MRIGPGTHSEYAVPGLEGVYVLGSHLKRGIMVVQQQDRAQMLIQYLVGSKILSEGAEVAVIGGGAAGLTAGVLAVEHGCRVTVFERRHRILEAFSGSQRFLHPYLYTWPKRGWRRESTNLQRLNWSADTAQNVAMQLRNQWESAKLMYQEVDPPSPHIREFCEVETIGLGDLDVECGQRQLWWSQQGNIASSAGFSVVILALGFGVEKPGHLEENKEWNSYWKDNSVHQPHVDLSGTEKHQNILVTGNGDSGLIDLIRAKLHDSSPNSIAQLLYQHQADLKSVVREICVIEGADRAGQLTSEDLTQQYCALDSRVDRILAQRVRQDTTVILRGRTQCALGPPAFPLNRFLVSRLLRQKAFRYVKSGSPVLDIQFDREITRLGTESALKRDFPTVYLKLSNL